MQAQPSLESIYEKLKESTRLQNISKRAARDAAILTAQARDEIFCLITGIPMEIDDGREIRTKSG